MLAPHRTWGRAAGLLAGLILAGTAGFAALSAYGRIGLSVLDDPVAGAGGNVTVFASGALLFLAWANQVYEARWRVFVVLPVLVAAAFLAFVLGFGFAFASFGDERAPGWYPLAAQLMVVGWLVPPLTVGWWTARVRRRQALDAALIRGAAAVLGIMLLVRLVLATAAG